jgi:uncharacterized membrane protein
MVKPWFRRSRFWVAVVSAVLIILVDGLGVKLPKDALITAASIIISYILGESAADVAGRLKS